jgi:hypothetical protein
MANKGHIWQPFGTALRRMRHAELPAPDRLLVQDDCIVIRIPRRTFMRKSALLLIAGIALATTALAGTARVNGNTAKDAAVASTPAASSAKAMKVASDNAKGSVSSADAKDSSRDPYAVPLFKDAKQMR